MAVDEQNSPPTVSRSAIQLQVGHVIVAPDGGHHTVTTVDHYDVGLGITVFTTDTGLELSYQGAERRTGMYDVLVG